MAKLTNTQRAQHRRQQQARAKATSSYMADMQRGLGLTNKKPSPNSQIKVEPYRRTTNEYPSLDSNVGSGAYKESLRYTGDKLIGIGTMHKSNLVPIFSQEFAEDISKMRRG
jgi:hypothetical protein